MHPCLLIGLDGFDEPVLIDKQRWVQIRGYSQTGGCHLAQLYKTSASDQILLAPVTALASRGKVLDGLAVIDTLHGAVNPPETECHLNSIHIPYYTGAISLSTVYSQPEITHFIVIFLIPPI